MADKKQLEILKQGVEAWNKWRVENPNRPLDLSEAELEGVNLSGINLRKANLFKANLSGAVLSSADLLEAYLIRADLSYTKLHKAELGGARLLSADLKSADLSEANLREADLRGTDLRGTDLSGTQLIGADLTHAKLSEANLRRAVFMDATLLRANLQGADLSGAILRHTDLNETKLQKAKLSGADLVGSQLRGADLSGAILRKADLRAASLVETTLVNTDLTNARIYGISAWNVNLKDAIQQDLIITRGDQPVITVDNLEVAQFIYLLLNNEKIRDVIDTITSKVVLILGRFTKERKDTLDALRDRLRELNLSPVMFDFDKPTDRTFTETVKTLAQLARFVIVDLAAARSVQQELAATVPTLAIPFVPIIKKGRKQWGMFADHKIYHWVLPLHEYDDDAGLLVALENKLIPAANEKRKELLRLKDYE